MTATHSNAVPALEAVDIMKSFGPLQALRGVSMKLFRGEVTAIVGDNGAGKSTFLKVLSGEHRPDSGELRLSGDGVVLRSTHEAQAAGIETVYQDLALAPDLTVPENVYLGREMMRRGWLGSLGAVDRAGMAKETNAVLDRLGIRLKFDSAPSRSLSGGQRQAVAVARAIKWGRHAILMDEPTAALGALQRKMVYAAIQSAAERNLAVLLVSHDLPQVVELADAIVVLRHGQNVARFAKGSVGVRDIIDAMLGAEVVS